MDIGLPLISTLLVVGGVGILAGVAIGFFIASRDLNAERAKAWDRGSNDTLHAVARTVPAPAVPLVVEVRNPYRRPRKAPREGVVYTSPVIPIPAPPSPLFDQDEHPTELRGD